MIFFHKLKVLHHVSLSFFSQGNIFRGDILPVKRDLFISLVKYSIEDILLTGDQSITDAISYCTSQKNIWYQVFFFKV